jgi:hypothetical protein
VCFRGPESGHKEKFRISSHISRWRYWKVGVNGRD